MIYVRPRTKMNVQRMRRHREKHHPVKYQTWKIPYESLEALQYPEVWDAFLQEVVEMFMVDVRRWNMWRKARLSAIKLERDCDIDYNMERITVSVRRLPPFRVIRNARLISYGPA